LGADVVIASKDKTKCEKLAQSLNERFNVNCTSLATDILDRESIRRAVEFIKTRHGRLDVLVNCGWSGKKNTFESITDEDWRYDIDVNLNAVFATIKETVPLLKETAGVIVNIASMYGHLAPDYKIYEGNEFANPPSYGVAKAGVIQLTKYLASFLSPYGIRVNCISPGPFPFTETCKNEEFIESLKSRTVLGRIGYPDDMKGVVALLCSDASKYITGQNICVDGGWSVW